MTIQTRLHPKFHPAPTNNKCGTLLKCSLPHWDVVRAAGVEPTTYGLEDRCSIR
jgi:hypothetical protein